MRVERNAFQLCYKKFEFQMNEISGQVFFHRNSIRFPNFIVQVEGCRPKLAFKGVSSFSLQKCSSASFVCQVN